MLYLEIFISRFGNIIYDFLENLKQMCFACGDFHILGLNDMKDVYLNTYYIWRFSYHYLEISFMTFWR